MFEIGYAHLNDAPAGLHGDVAGVSAELDRALLRGLEKEPAPPAPGRRVRGHAPDRRSPLRRGGLNCGPADSGGCTIGALLPHSKDV